MLYTLGDGGLVQTPFTVVGAAQASGIYCEFVRVHHMVDGVHDESRLGESAIIRRGQRIGASMGEEGVSAFRAVAHLFAEQEADRKYKHVVIFPLAGRWFSYEADGHWKEWIDCDSGWCDNAVLIRVFTTTEVEGKTYRITSSAPFERKGQVFRASGLVDMCGSAIVDDYSIFAAAREFGWLLNAEEKKAFWLWGLTLPRDLTPYDLAICRSICGFASAEKVFHSFVSTTTTVWMDYRLEDLRRVRTDAADLSAPRRPLLVLHRH